MNHRPPSDEKSNTNHYLRQVDDTYIFDCASGLYKPKTYRIEEEGREQQRGKKSKLPFFVDVRRDWFTVTISIATLIVISIYTYYAKGQWHEMINAASEAHKNAVAATDAATFAGQQINLSRDALHVAERPWVVQTPANIPRLMPSASVRAYVQILNIGKSPSLDTRINVQVHLFKKFPLPNPLYDAKTGSPNQSRAVIAPNAPILLQLSNMFLFDEAFREIQSGELTYFIYGEIRYSDAFPPVHEHVTHFCIQYHPEDPSRRLWAACAFYNDAN